MTMTTMSCSTLLVACLAAVMVNLATPHDIRFHRFRGRQRRQEPPAPERPRPIFDQIFEPLLGEAGTLREVEQRINVIGGELNRKIDSIHDEDHGVKICNQEEGADSHGVCTITAGKCKALHGQPVAHCDSSHLFNPFNPFRLSTCCKFEKTCSEVSDETVAYFKSDPSVMEAHTRCRLGIRSRTGVCQIRIDFLDFKFPPADPVTGRCSEKARLRITNSIGGPASPR